MSDDIRNADIAQLKVELAQAREIAELGLKASISALASLQAIIQGMRVESLLGQGELPKASLDQADDHVRRGLALLKNAIERDHNDGR